MSLTRMTAITLENADRRFNSRLPSKGGRFICHSRIYREAVAAELQKWSDKITSCTKG